MTDDFKKALEKFNTEGNEIYREGINEGAWWAHEWCKSEIPEVYQYKGIYFFEHEFRTMCFMAEQNELKLKALAQQADALAEALEFYKLQGEFRPYNVSSSEFYVDDYGNTAHKALTKYRKFKEGKDG